MPRYGKRDVIHKPEVHYVLHCGRMRMEPRPQLTRRPIESLMKFGRVVLQGTDRHTRRHTDALIAILRFPVGGGGKVNLE